MAGKKTTATAASKKTKAKSKSKSPAPGPGKSFAKSPSTTPKKSTSQPAPSPAAATGTTPLLSRAQSYLRYKNRGGPRAPGSKQIPQGAENCLEGLTFVITGVLESLERDEAADIIKKYRGKVTTNVSGKTSYIVIGEEAGESKLAKAKQAGTKQIDEDGLLDLICTLPSPGKMAGKKTTATAASKKTKAKSKSKSPAPGPGKSFAKSPSTTPKKSTPQPDPSPAAATGTTPSLSRALRYKNRGGPRAPGSKQIPQGAENCLEGLTFVITGVLESLERDEAADIIKKYGGKVTTNVSGKTSYIVIGEEAGESKLAKAKQVGTKQIDEDGLLDLIRTLPSPSKMAGKKTTATAASKKIKAKSKSKSPAPGPAKLPSVKSHDPQPATPISSQLTSTRSFYGSAPSTSPSVAKPSSEPQDLLWVDKYRPRSTKTIIGQQGDRSNAKKLAQWLQKWDRNHQKGGAKRPLQWGGGGGRDDGSSFKAALLSGPPGIGKTTTATLVCEENGYSYVEMNASSTHNKRTLHDEVANQLSCLSLGALMKGGVSSGQRHALIVDEVDGMAGNEDRGGMQELIQMIKMT